MNKPKYTGLNYYVCRRDHRNKPTTWFTYYARRFAVNCAVRLCNATGDAYVVLEGERPAAALPTDLVELHPGGSTLINHWISLSPRNH